MEETKEIVKKDIKIEEPTGSEDLVSKAKNEAVADEKANDKKIAQIDDKKLKFRTVTPSRPKIEKRVERKKEFEEKVLEIARVARVVKGGRRFKFRAAVVIGDKNGKVGYGMGKGSEVQEAVRKAVAQAKKIMIEIKRNDTTIPADITSSFKGAKIILKPAPKGAGIIAGGPVRAVVDAAGISDVSSKMLGSSNKVNNMIATFEALKKLTKLEG